MSNVWYDDEKMSRLNASDVSAYLRENGWSTPRTQRGKWTLWLKGDEFEVICPISREMRDYSKRMAEVVHNIALSEEREPLAVYGDLLFSSADIIRFRQIGRSADDHTLSLGENETKASFLRIILSSAAVAASSSEKRAVYGGRQSQEVSNYINSVRVGVEAGSFIWKIVSKVPVELKTGSLFEDEIHSENDDSALLDANFPFPRKVTATLAKALEVILEAANNAAATGNIDKFQEGVQFGVSANLCEALRGLISGDSDNTIETSFRWSCTGPSAHKLPKKFIFDNGHAETIEAAAKTFREREPVKDIDLSGWLVNLDKRDKNTLELGSVKGIIRADIDNFVKDINILIDANDYKKAIMAFDKNSKVSITGTLRKNAKKYTLEDAVNFRILEEQEYE